MSTSFPAPAPVSPPPAPTEGARNAIRVILVVAAALLVFGGVAVAGTAAVGLSTFRVITDEQPLPRAMRSLTIDTGDIPTSVRITVERDATEPQVRVRMVNSTMAGQQRLAVAGDAGDARVTFEGRAPGYLHWARGGEVTVALPPDVASRLTVTTQQRTGLLRADADVERLVARTTRGMVILGASARSIEVQIENGRVETRDPITVRDSLSATVDRGDIDVELTGAAPRTLQAITRRGDVEVELPGPGPYDVRAQGSSTTVRVPETTEAGAPQVTARAERGSVTIDEERR